MAQKLIYNGSAPDDGTGDTLRAGAGKINDNFTDLYTAYNFGKVVVNGQSNIVSTSLTGALTLIAGNSVIITTNAAAKSVTINVDGLNENANGDLRIGDPEHPSIIIPPADSSDPVIIQPPGNTGITIPPNNSGPISIGPEDPNDSTAPGILVPPNGGSDDPEGTDDDLRIRNPDGDIVIGPENPEDPENPSGPSTPGIVVPPPGSGRDIEIRTGMDPWQVLYTDGTGTVNSSPFIKVTPDGDDNEGKSLHLHTGEYDIGSNNTVLQSAIYFVDDFDSDFYDPETTDSKRAASVRFAKRPLGQGLIATPWGNYNDGSSQDMGGVGVWRHTESESNHTKITLNDEGNGPSVHGVYVGRGAISFLQDLEGGETPNTDGQAYVLLPGIGSANGDAFVGQIFSNPYRNENLEVPEGYPRSAFPYWGLGYKPTTQLVEDSPPEGLEASEREPGVEVLVWTSQGRVGVMNNDPQYELDVDGDINFTSRLLVDDVAGTNGQVLTSTGPNSSPVWANIPTDNNTTYELSIGQSYVLEGSPQPSGVDIVLTGSDESNNTIQLFAGIDSALHINVSSNTAQIKVRDTIYTKGNISGNVVFARHYGTVQKANVVDDFTLNAIANIAGGESITLILTQANSGNHAMTATNTYLFAEGYKTLSTSNGSIDMLNIFYDGTTHFVTLTTGYA